MFVGFTMYISVYVYKYWCVSICIYVYTYRYVLCIYRERERLMKMYDVLCVVEVILTSLHMCIHIHIN